MKYIMICNQGHVPETMTVEAQNDDEAMSKMMELAKSHNALNHPEKVMTDEELMEYIKENWKKE